MNNQYVTTVEWVGGSIGFDGTRWQVIYNQDGSAEYHATMANVGESLLPSPGSPALGHPGAMVAADVASVTGGTVSTKPNTDPPGTIY